MLTDGGYRHIGVAPPAGKQGDWFAAVSLETDKDDA
jgi:hypothetical protein